jgi:predicted HicB family RNase H-like nuclease
MARPKLEDVTDRLAMRIDERVRYLAEIGARAQGMSFREYIETYGAFRGPDQRKECLC